MSTFKVSFKDGIAVSAEVVDPTLYKDIKKFYIKNGCCCIEWYLIECENENEATETAEMVVNSIWGKLIG